MIHTHEPVLCRLLSHAQAIKRLQQADTPATRRQCTEYVYTHCVPVRSATSTATGARVREGGLHAPAAMCRLTCSCDACVSAAPRRSAHALTKPFRSKRVRIFLRVPRAVPSET